MKDSEIRDTTKQLVNCPDEGFDVVHVDGNV